MEKIKPPLIVIAGPTASGKSDLAIQLARTCNGEIISADSRQVYRGMDIGTGKVTKKEQRQAPHWMLDVANPRRQYSVAQWVRGAQRAIADITRRGKLPIICGGTGFWIDTLVYGLTLPEVKPNATLRAQLQKLSAPELFARLKKMDPRRAKTIDRHNPVRLIRAIEIASTIGKVPPLRRHSEYEVLYLGIRWPKEALARRIAKRLDARLKGDMIAEVKKLHAAGVSFKRLESFGLEYRWVARYLNPRFNLGKKEIRDGLLRDIIAYSKRQMTWWRKNSDITWLDKK